MKCPYWRTYKKFFKTSILLGTKRKIYLNLHKTICSDFYPSAMLWEKNFLIDTIAYTTQKLILTNRSNNTCKRRSLNYFQKAFQNKKLQVWTSLHNGLDMMEWCIWPNTKTKCVFWFIVIKNGICKIVKLTFIVKST